MSSLLSDARRVFALAWPVVLSMLSYSILSGADALFVGRLGTVPLAAIGLAVTATFLFLALPIGLVRGLRVTTAQAQGAGRAADVDTLASQALWLSLVAGLAVAAVGAFGPLVFRHLGATAEVQAEALRYFSVRVHAAPLALGVLALTAWFEGRGDTRTPMIANVTANVLCIGLDAVLVPGLGPIPALGIRGAAWAGVVSLGVAGAILLRAAAPTLRRVPWRPHRLLLLESARMGFPIGVQRFLDVAAWTVLTGVLASLGDAQLAAHVLAIRVLMLSFLPGLAIAEATAVLVGQSVGARDPEAAHRWWRAGSAVAFGVMSVGGVAFVALPTLLVAPLHAAPEVVPIAIHLLWIAAAFQLVDSVATVTYFSLDGAGDTRFTLVASITLSWFVKLPLGVACARWGGLGAVGAWLGLTGEIVVLLVVLLLRWRSRRWYGDPGGISPRGA
jgi:MATE family multidrug resistance protein